MTRWGQGVWLFRAGVAVCLAVFAAEDHLFPGLMPPPLPRAVAWPTAAVLALAGLALYAAAIGRAYRAVDERRLETGGVYSLVRHPMYAAWLVCLVPAAALLRESWPSLAAPLVMLALYRPLVAAEERHLAAVHGQAYLDYMRRVSGIAPRKPLTVAALIAVTAWAGPGLVADQMDLADEDWEEIQAEPVLYGRKPHHMFG